ncbi:GPI mannosyltransferase 4 [Alternaria alternata]|nr:GPI mannosyltransferase 4 [Alternaria alternata]
MARIRLAHVHLALAMGGFRLRCLAVGRILDTASTHAVVECRHGGLGHPRAGRFTPRASRCRYARRIFLCDLDVPDTHLLEQSRNTVGALESGVDPEDNRRQGRPASVRLPI